jgi:hypothetical protein
MNKPLSSKYHPLTLHLHAQAGDRVRMTFAEIERVIGGKLPPSAASRAWWSNNPSNNVMTKAWLEAGYESEQVDLSGRKLVFKRAAPRKAPAPRSEAGSSDRLALFGWMRGTIATMGDLTEPADSRWAERIDDEYPSVA